MPKLWQETIESHRRAVRDATVETTAMLVAEHGLRSVTMSRIAKETGIGRATLYKYFPDVEAILAAWHERQIDEHLERLAAARDQAHEPAQQLRTVLETYAILSHGSHGDHDPELAALLHGHERVRRAQRQVREIIERVLTEAAAAGDVRDDVAPRELASFCLHALTAARGARSKAAIRRLVDVTLAGLAAPRPPSRARSTR